MALPKEFDARVVNTYHDGFDWYDWRDTVKPPRLEFYGYLMGLTTGKTVAAAMIRGTLARYLSDGTTDRRSNLTGALVLRRPSGQDVLDVARIPADATLSPNGNMDYMSTWLDAYGGLPQGILTVDERGVTFQPQPASDNERVQFIPVDPSPFLAASGLAVARFNWPATSTT